MAKKEKTKKSLITIRQLNSNREYSSLGLTFPVSLVKDTELKPGKYVCEYKKVNGKWVLTFVLESIWED